MARILIVEDNQAELEKAIEVGKEFGHEIIAFNPTENGRKWIKLMEEADCVITDLFFKPSGARCKEIPPAGLTVVIHAMSLGKPVVVCTSAAQEDTSWGHHGEAIGWLYDGYIMATKMQGFKVPFGWSENKSWTRAFEIIKSRMG